MASSSETRRRPSGLGPDDTPGSDPAGRALALTLAAALGFAAAVMVMAALELGETPLRSDLSPADAVAGGVEFYEGSAAAKTVSTIAFWASAAAAAAAVAFALLIAASGRWSRWLMPAAGLAVLLGATGILINNV